MDKILINGGKKLNGSLDIPTAKNSCLSILAATLLCDDEVVLHNITPIKDVLNMEKILQHLGCFVKRENATLTINTSAASKFDIDATLARQIRSSIFMLGSMLTKFKRAKLAYPGGCDIGARPIDLHIKGLRELNIEIIERHGQLVCNGENAKSAMVVLDFPSVGATENIMFAAVKLKGKTTIVNAAKEPEIVDVANFINQMGGRIYGAGTDTIEIEGVDRLGSVEYTPLPDRIITGTYLIAAAMTGGKVELCKTREEHVLSLTTKLKQSGFTIDVKSDTITLTSNGKPICIPQIETSPYPGFPTDLQAPMLTLQTICKGTSLITENLFETRFKHVPELVKMGANITLKGKTAIVHGVDNLFGAEVMAEDLRGGAALVLAGLSATGYTTVNDVYHIDRGYYKIEDDLKKLGADIKRV